MYLLGVNWKKKLKLPVRFFSDLRVFNLKRAISSVYVRIICSWSEACVVSGCGVEWGLHGHAAPILHCSAVLQSKEWACLQIRWLINKTSRALSLLKTRESSGTQSDSKVDTNREASQWLVSFIIPCTVQYTSNTYTYRRFPSDNKRV